MTRTVTLGLLLALFMAAPASAQLPWSYYVRFDAADGAGNILLGNEFQPGPGGEGGTPVSVIMRAGGAAPGRIDITTPRGTTDLFAFGPSNWEVVETPPTDLVANRYVLHFGFTPHGSLATVSGSVDGTIVASSVFTSGTGNFTIGVDDRSIDLGDGVSVRFGVRESESQSVITMTVYEGVLAETPEPTPLILAGIGLAGVAGTRLRRK